MVAGQAIDPSEVEAFSQEAVLVIAHNAGFDRRFLEKLAPAFAHKAWACSQSQIDWAGEGLEGTRLSYLVAGAGFFYDSHRAVNDCLAAIELLAAPLPRSTVSGLSQLLENARKPSWRIWAENAPFDLKDALKARGYRWNPDGTPFPKAWYTDVPDENRQPSSIFCARKSTSAKSSFSRGKLMRSTGSLTAFDILLALLLKLPPRQISPIFG